jgi:hypothetical protein
VLAKNLTSVFKSISSSYLLSQAKYVYRIVQAIHLPQDLSLSALCMISSCTKATGYLLCLIGDREVDTSSTSLQNLKPSSNFKVMFLKLQQMAITLLVLIELIL